MFIKIGVQAIVRAVRVAGMNTNENETTIIQEQNSSQSDLP